MTLYQAVIAEVAPAVKPLAEAALVTYRELYESATYLTPEQNAEQFRSYLKFKIEERVSK